MEIPHHRLGNHDPKAQGATGQSMWMFGASKAANFLKTKMTDYFTLSEEEVGKLILEAASAK